MTRSGRAFALLSVCLLFTTGVLTMPMTEGQYAPKPEKAAAEPPDYEMMIDGLASRNPAPKIVKFEFARLPLFPIDYDWDEQDRILELRAQLARNEDPRLWEHFLKHMHDERYALTLESASDDSFADNDSVGDICWNFAWARLDFARVHWKRIPGEPQFDVLRLDLLDKALPTWRKERAGKSLYELQLEVCEIALPKIAAEKKLTHEAKDRITKKLRDNIAILNKTKKPLFFMPGLDGAGTYNATKAQKIRDRYEQEQAEKEKKK